MAENETVKDTFSVEEYRADPVKALDCAAEVGRVSVIDNDGQEIFAIDRRGPGSDEDAD